MSTDFFGADNRNHRNLDNKTNTNNTRRFWFIDIIFSRRLYNISHPQPLSKTEPDGTYRNVLFVVGVGGTAKVRVSRRSMCIIEEKQAGLSDLRRFVVVIIIATTAAATAHD